MIFVRRVSLKSTKFTIHANKVPKLDVGIMRASYNSSALLINSQTISGLSKWIQDYFMGAGDEHLIFFWRVIRQIGLVVLFCFNLRERRTNEIRVFFINILRILDSFRLFNFNSFELFQKTQSVLSCYPPIIFSEIIQPKLIIQSFSIFCRSQLNLLFCCFLVILLLVLFFLWVKYMLLSFNR